MHTLTKLNWEKNAHFLLNVHSDLNLLLHSFGEIENRSEGKQDTAESVHKPVT